MTSPTDDLVTHDSELARLYSQHYHLKLPSAVLNFISWALKWSVKNIDCVGVFAKYVFYGHSSKKLLSEYLKS